MYALIYVVVAFMENITQIRVFSIDFVENWGYVPEWLFF
jgi:hypothetical protein